MNARISLTTPQEGSTTTSYYHFIPNNKKYPGLIPTIVDVEGRAPLLIPKTSFTRAAVMGNEQSSANAPRHCVNPHQQARNAQEVRNQQQRASNLTVMMEQHERNQRQRQEDETCRTGNIATQGGGGTHACEADSACGPPRQRPALGSSAPSAPQARTVASPRRANAPAPTLHRNFSTGAFRSNGIHDRRCLSSKELGTIAPPSGSPYATMLVRKEQLEESTRRRLQEIRSIAAREPPEPSDESTSSSRPREARNEYRNRRRTLHNQAIVEDLCALVADLFLSESKLLSPTHYGVSEDPSTHSGKDHVVKTVHNFVSALPMRYALGAETPSEVLLHMRLMAAVRSDRTKAVVHIHNLQDEKTGWNSTVTAQSVINKKMLRLVTISCRDAQGLLERITKALASGGSRVLDADVMLSTDGITLDRFVVEMSGRLRLDKLSQLIEEFLKEREEEAAIKDVVGGGTTPTEQCTGGPLYYNEIEPMKEKTREDIRLEMQTAVPLTHVLANTNREVCMPELPTLRKMHSMPDTVLRDPRLSSFRLSMRTQQGHVQFLSEHAPSDGGDLDRVSAPPAAAKSPIEPPSIRQRRPLVNRRATPDLGFLESASRHELQPLEYVTVPSTPNYERAVPLIPFEELMLIETIGTGRVSTIYRAAWQRAPPSDAHLASVHMVALKVAMVSAHTGDTGHVDELRREADIAARLQHPNICDLVGVAADTECFCLAYDFCEGGSLLSLLSDSRRYYEYLPIAMDIANGMAYLHSRDLIHRDLKPSNILLTKDRRAKIADFGMSVANRGQELTAETGTYRYMAPEVIRHESYSSNADVYSFGVCLWQLITREVPFASMTPIQAAYAVAEGRRPPIPPSTPRRLKEIIEACWDQQSYRRPSFTYIALALADYAKMAFSPANVGAQTLQIANEMLAHVNGNSTVNVDFTTPVIAASPPARVGYVDVFYGRNDSISSDIGLEI